MMPLYAFLLAQFCNYHREDIYIEHIQSTSSMPSAVLPL